MGKASRRKAATRRASAEWDRSHPAPHLDAAELLEQGCGRCGIPLTDSTIGSMWLDRFWCADCAPDYDICGCCLSLAGFSRQQGTLGPRKDVPGWRDHNGTGEPGFDEWLAWFETWTPPSAVLP